MSARVPLQLRRGLLVAASIVALHALLILLCYAVPPVQKHPVTQHRSPQRVNQPQSKLSQEQEIRHGSLNVSMLTATMTGCSRAADWQAMGLYHSFLRREPSARVVPHHTITAL